MNQFNMFLRNVERDLDDGLHEQLARHVRYLATEQPIHYEKRFLILVGRNYMTTITRNRPDMFELTITAFLWKLLDPVSAYNPMFVHRTLLVFIRDWFFLSDLEYDIVKYHQEYDGGDPGLQRCINRSPGWHSMAIDRQLMVVMMVVYDQFTFHGWLEYIGELVRRFLPFWDSISTMAFYKSCTALRELIIQKQDAYLGLCRNIDWMGIRDELRRELNAQPQV